MKQLLMLFLIATHFLKGARRKHLPEYVSEGLDPLPLFFLAETFVFYLFNTHEMCKNKMFMILWHVFSFNLLMI